MEINAIFDAFPGEAMLLFESGIVFVMALWLIIGIYHDLVVLVDNVICQKRKAAFCMGIHNGSIKEVCRNHNCPHSRQCVYHAPRRRFIPWIKDGIKKIKRH